MFARVYVKLPPEEQTCLGIMRFLTLASCSREGEAESLEKSKQPFLITRLLQFH